MLRGSLLYQFPVNRSLWLLLILLIGSRSVAQSLKFQQLNSPFQQVTALLEDEHGLLWIGTNQGLFRYNGYRFEHFQHIPFDTLSLTDNSINTLFQDQNHRLWIGTAKGLNTFEPANNSFLSVKEQLNTHPSQSSPASFVLEQPVAKGSDTCWVSTATQLELRNSDTAIPLASYPYTEPIKQTSPTVLLTDRSGNVWLGTDSKGLFYLPLARHSLLNNNSNSALLTSSPAAILEDHYGRMWWTDKEGQLWYRTDNTPPQKILTQTGLHALAIDQQKQLWVGGLSKLHKIDLNATQPHLLNSYDIQDDAGKILDIYEDPIGQLWLLTPTYFGLFDQEEGIHYGLLYRLEPTTATKLSGNKLIHQTADGTFWLGTSEGLKSYRQGEKDFHHFRHDPLNPTTIAHEYISGICPDPLSPDESLWITTRGGGLNRFFFKDRKFEHLKLPHQSLPIQQLGGIISDSLGQLWLLTSQGLVRYDPLQENIKQYTTTDGLLSNAFEDGAAYAADDGTLFFTSIIGINKFSSQVSATEIPSSSFLFEQAILYENGMEQTTLLSSQEQLLIPAESNVFTITFSTVDLIDPRSQQYRYTLSGYQEEWQQLGANSKLTFSTLPPGQYQLTVQHTKQTGEWVEPGNSISIVVQRPWWKKWWAYLAYAGILLALAYAVYQILLSRQLEKSEALRLKEMDGLRARLYTNITHEFRTPLTVIMGMADELEQTSQTITTTSKDKSAFASGFSLIKRNSQQLLRLVNQLLDLAKLEDEKLNLHYIQADAIAYLEYLCESFYSLAEEKDLQIVFYPEQRPLLMDLDEVKWQQIIFNLVSNAIKFTAAGGRILFHTETIAVDNQPWLQIKINDTGRGIPADQLPHIFDRFYQVDDSSTRQGEGTGIGLAFTKELIELMGGTVSVKSELDVGSTFLLRLPITNHAELTTLVAAKETALPPALQNDETQDSSPTLLPTSATNQALVLLVEDNADVATYIQQILSNQYEVKWAENGLLGKEQALQLIPDLIISDVMMPGMDGFTLTEHLKTDERTSHIPIILLTAKASQDDKISGLKTGADAYLMKPFNKAELMVRLENLLELRKTLHTHYAKVLEQSPYSSSSAVVDELPSPEELFLQKLHRIILKHLDDTEFTVELLGKQVQLSRAQLYRKLKAIADKTPVGLIKEIRLRKSTELLTSTNLSISEVAYSTGFSDPNYFSRAFHQQFGHSPKAYREAVKKGHRVK